MAAPKNHAKAGGRKKGVPNKITRQVKDQLKDLWEAEYKYWPDIMAKLRKENPAVYMNVFEKLLPYFVAKKRDITSDDKSIIPTIVIKEDRDDG